MISFFFFFFFFGGGPHPARPPPGPTQENEKLVTQRVSGRRPAFEEPVRPPDTCACVGHIVMARPVHPIWPDGHIGKHIFVSRLARLSRPCTRGDRHTVARQGISHTASARRAAGKHAGAYPILCALPVCACESELPNPKLLREDQQELARERFFAAFCVCA